MIFWGHEHNGPSPTLVAVDSFVTVAIIVSA